MTRGQVAALKPPPLATRHLARHLRPASSWALALLKPLGLGYAAICGVAYLAQRRLQYFPSEGLPPHPRTISPTFAAVREIELRSADETRCLAWHWEEPTRLARDAPAPSFWWIGDAEKRRELEETCEQLRRSYPKLARLDVLLLHGNAGDRSHRLGWMHLLRDGLGMSVTVLDYRGYGGSDGSPTEAGLIADAAAAARWLRETWRSRPRGQRGGRNGRKLVLWGESIGSAVAVALSADQDVKSDAVVIEAGFSSCVDIASSLYPWFPLLHLFMHDKFDSVARAERLPRDLPVLHLHGTLDEIAHISLGRRLFDALPCAKKRFVELRETGHNNIPFRDPTRYVKEIATFLVEHAV